MAIENSLKLSSVLATIVIYTHTLTPIHLFICTGTGCFLCDLYKWRHEQEPSIYVHTRIHMYPIVLYPEANNEGSSLIASRKSNKLNIAQDGVLIIVILKRIASVLSLFWVEDASKC